MAQRIQASLSAGLCLIISKEGLSTGPRNRDSKSSIESDAKQSE